MALDRRCDIAYYRVDIARTYPLLDKPADVVGVGSHYGDLLHELKLIAPGLDYANNEYFFLFTERGYRKYIDKIQDKVASYNRVENFGLEEASTNPEWYSQKRVLVYSVNDIPMDKVAYRDKMQIALRL